MATTKGKGREKDTVEVEELVTKSELFIEQNSKKIIGAIIAVAVIVAAILVYHHGYAIPQQRKAESAMFKGEMYFYRDSFALALNGDGMGFDGFNAIIEQYGGTKSGNLAKAYAGICYYKLGDNESAKKLLESFKMDDSMVAPAITGLIGSCYTNMGDIKEGASFFEKAAKAADNELISPIYLMKAGSAYEKLEQYDKALKAYTTIKEKYYNSTEASYIDKYIYRASALAQ